MRLLLDTHALLWWLNDDRKLGSQARVRIDNQANKVLVSIVSLWEIVLKVRINKLDGDVAQIAREVSVAKFTLLQITSTHLVTLAGMQTLSDHKDPFDHLLIAQAINEDAIFVSQDRHVPSYPVKFLTCSDAPQVPK